MRKGKKNNAEAELDYYYRKELKNKKVPLLILDPSWHELFPDHRKNDEIRKCEKELNNLVKKQGQTSNDLKDYDKAKKVIMDNIVNNMTDGNEPTSYLKSRKQEKNQKLLEELNVKIAEASELQRKLPMQIELANKELLIASMRVCYAELSENTDRIEELDIWIRKAREELKDRILAKQDMEMRNTQVYKYMHNLLGAQVVEIFDKKHRIWKGNIEENRSVAK